MSTTTDPGTAQASTFRHHLHPLRIIVAFALLASATVLAHRNGLPVWIVAIGVFGPDLSFLAAIGAPVPSAGTLPERAVRPYNLLHHPCGPILLTTLSFAGGAMLGVTAGLAWLSHQAWDRGLGYNLRNADGTVRM